MRLNDKKDVFEMINKTAVENEAVALNFDEIVNLEFRVLELQESWLGNFDEIFSLQQEIKKLSGGLL